MDLFQVLEKVCKGFRVFEKQFQLFDAVEIGKLFKHDLKVKKYVTISPAMTGELESMKVLDQSLLRMKHWKEEGREGDAGAEQPRHLQILERVALVRYAGSIALVRALDVL